MTARRAHAHSDRRALLMRREAGRRADDGLPAAVREIAAAERLLDVAVFARRVRISSRTARRWCVDGRLRFTLTPSGRYRVPASEIDRVLEIVGQDGHVGRTAMASSRATQQAN